MFNGTDQGVGFVESDSDDSIIGKEKVVSHSDDGLSDIENDGNKVQGKMYCREHFLFLTLYRKLYPMTFSRHVMLYLTKCIICQLILLHII